MHTFLKMFIDQLLKKTSHLLLIHLFFNGFFLHHTRIQWPIHRRRLHLFYWWASLWRPTLRSLDCRPKPRQYLLPMCLSSRPLNILNTTFNPYPLVNQLNDLEMPLILLHVLLKLHHVLRPFRQRHLFHQRLDIYWQIVWVRSFVSGGILTKGRSH